MQNRHKYSAQRTVYSGQTYDSKSEAAYAQTLDFRKLAGQIREWGRGAPVTLIPGKRADRVTYCPDFWVVEALGDDPYYVDVKGVETPVWKLKMRLLKYTNPGYRLLIVSKDGERWL